MHFSEEEDDCILDSDCLFDKDAKCILEKCSPSNSQNNIVALGSDNFLSKNINDSGKRDLSTYTSIYNSENINPFNCRWSF